MSTDADRIIEMVRALEQGGAQSDSAGSQHRSGEILREFSNIE